MSTLEGIGPDAHIITNEKGASQSYSPYRFDLLPPLAIAHVAMILKKGAEKYGATSYINIDADQHLNHAMQHIFGFLTDDMQEGDPIEHAKHAACRILFWLDCLERYKQETDELVKSRNSGTNTI